MMAKEKATAKQTKGVRVTMHEVAAAAGVLTATKDYVPAGLALDCVMVDNRAAMYKATAHLIALGYRAFGLIGGPLHYTTAREREAGFLDALRDAGIGDDSIWIEHGDWHIQGGYEATMRLLARARLPLALLSVNNETTIGLLKAIHEKRLRIPEDVALVAYDEMSWASAYAPPLTVINQHPLYQGDVAAELLLSRMQDPNRPVQQVILESQLIVRQSCGSTAA